MDAPPRCPARTCAFHRRPRPGFYQRRGTFRAACRDHPIQRYACKGCGKSFSDQTFRADRYDKKPHLNERVMEAMASGIGYREAACSIGLSRQCFTAKVRKISRNAALLDQNLQIQARRRALLEGDLAPVTLQLGEVDTFETCRSTQPVAVPIVIEPRSRFIIAAGVAATAPARSTNESAADASPPPNDTSICRVDESRSERRRVLDIARRLFPGRRVVTVRAPESAQLRASAAEVFPPSAHGPAPHDPALIANGAASPIRLVAAILRDHLSLLRLASWLHPKRREHLLQRLDFHRARKNYTRGRFRHDRKSAGEWLGITPRMMRLRELYHWRQDWGQRSPCPFGDGTRSFLELSWKGVTPGDPVRIHS